jgi:hypothetical protein
MPLFLARPRVSRRLRPLFLATGVGAIVTAVTLLAGCGSSPVASYRRVDPKTPEFQAAVARETAAETAKGKSASDAAEIATRRVTEQTIATEKQRRTDSVAPLTAALAALERPRGCWAYTATTSTTKDGKTVVDVERFDPFQPDERLWTLLTRDGRAPTTDEQASYRRDRMKRWKRQQSAAAKQKPVEEKTTRRALYSNLTVDRPDTGGATVFAFDREPRSALAASIAGVRETYTIDEASSRIVRHAHRQLAPTSVLAGTVKIDLFDYEIDYTVIDPALAPFPAKKKAHYRLHAFGTDTGEVTVETSYADYRRVKCYEDRFEVNIGTTSVQDYLPE